MIVFFLVSCNQYITIGVFLLFDNSYQFKDQSFLSTDVFMKRIYFSLVLVVLSTGLFGQTTAIQYFDKWVKAYNRAVDIYTVTSCDKGLQDALLKEAHDSLTVSVNYLQKAVALNSLYSEDANVQYAQSAILFSLFHSRSCDEYLFTSEQAVKWANTLESKWTVVKPLLLSDMRLKSTASNQSDLDNIQYDSYWESYIIHKVAKDTVGMSNAMHRYIALLRTKYTNPLTFCGALYRDTTMKKATIRLKNLLDGTTNAMWGTHELDYNILDIEVEAQEFVKKQPVTASKTLDALSRLALLEKLMIIELGMELDKPAYVVKQFDELTRLKEATRILELNDMYQKVYTVLVKSSRSTDEDRWKYLEAMKNLAQLSTTDEDLMENMTSDMTDVCNQLFDACQIQEVSEDQFKRLQAYYASVGCKEGTTKCLNAVATIDSLRLKREKNEAFQRKWGLSVGFAPIKTLFFGGKQASFFADIKTFGINQGVRYCSFDGFTDNYRFYSWLINNKKPGGSYVYSGYEASYWFALFSMRDEFVQQRLCLEYRYGHYDFEPLTNATLLNRSTGESALTGITVNPVGINKDVTLVYRLQLFLGRRFFIEGNVGLGLGYRTLKADQNLKTYEIDNDSYNDTRWNRITLPGRLGLRCGITLF